MLAGLPGLRVGPDAAFRWTLYLLLSLWPVSVYVAARLFGVRALGRGGVGRDVAVPRERDRDRLRAARVHLDRLRGVGAAVGIDDAAARVGLHAGGRSATAAASCPPSRSTALTRAALRDGLPGALPLSLWPLVAGAPVLARAAAGRVDRSAARCSRPRG